MVQIQSSNLRSLQKQEAPRHHGAFSLTVQYHSEQQRYTNHHQRYFNTRFYVNQPQVLYSSH